MSGLLRRRRWVDPGPPEGHFGGPEGHFGSHFGSRNRRNSEGQFRLVSESILEASKKIILGKEHLVQAKRMVWRGRGCSPWCGKGSIWTSRGAFGNHFGVFASLSRRPGVDPGPPKGHFGCHLGVRNRSSSEVRFRSRLSVGISSSEKIILGKEHFVQARRMVWRGGGCSPWCVGCSPC